MSDRGFRGSMAQTETDVLYMGVHTNHRHWGLCHLLSIHYIGLNFQGSVPGPWLFL